MPRKRDSNGSLMPPPPSTSTSVSSNESLFFPVHLKLVYVSVITVATCRNTLLGKLGINATLTRGEVLGGGLQAEMSPRLS